MIVGAGSIIAGVEEAEPWEVETAEALTEIEIGYEYIYLLCYT